ncbi:DEAD/DEAH box helicase [Pseudomonas citronellolis]|uniref:DEAD/DEAH box helicase n=1 Tax=Pseudomonas citronellolis TaxID=53408 RepID=UPI0023E3E63F|nr:DEAD/DEAH box helicase family protein [Pseudomonas citronellolis]MDF3934281.1 DEAD/DEAH box helicase family protein [Pseudomonas citronellolis]
MVDFGKRLKNKEIEKKIDPIEIYNSLDRTSDTGPLRPSQKAVLKEWNSKRRSTKDNIVKLHTGEGKTLIGLLMLQSKINETGEPCLFLCPNIYLAYQAMTEAAKFGIKFCEIGNDKEIPEDFILGKTILITHVQKLFNGKTKFGLNNKSIDVGAVVLDDSHACIDAIRSSLTIRVPSTHDVYKSTIEKFEKELREQGEGSFLEVKSGSNNTMLPIAYWSWIDRKDEITALLLDHKNDTEIAFVWPVIKDNIEDCQAFITGNYLEISPQIMPIKAFGSFFNAKHRILMSATTQDDAFSIKGLGFDTSAIQNPLTNNELKWSGEKMIVIPTLIDVSLDREHIVNWLGNLKNTTYGVVFLAPDFSKSTQYTKLGSKVSDKKTIFENVDALKGGNFECPIVFVNRYDGIDLPDRACRILVLDSKPYFDSLLDRYEECCRADSDLINIKIAQKVEQGLGRSVRGEKDYSIIIVTGGDLAKFIKSQATNKYFSAQTKKQIEIGIQASGFAREELKENNDPHKVLFNLMSQALRRDEGWKEYYAEAMSELPDTDPKEALYDILKLELDAEAAYSAGKLQRACELMQRLCDKNNDNPSEKGWYTQQLARYKYKISKIESNETQQAAFALNSQLLKPKSGVTYKKITYKNEHRMLRIKKWLERWSTHQELNLAAEEIADNLAFGTTAEKFESAVKSLGEALGFVSQRPDKEIKTGPDNLWCLGIDDYLFFECKSEVNEDRKEINKDEVSQFNSHCGWFSENYGDANCNRVLVIPTNKLSHQANFTHPAKILRKNGLKKLRDNFKGFIKELNGYEIGGISDAKIQQLLEYHKLSITDLKDTYSEDYVSLKK